MKPENVFLHHDGSEEVVKLIDFGIAKLLTTQTGRRHPVTVHGELVGTPSYMSPEQLMGCPCDGKSDVYSLAMMLYEMLSGRLPFALHEESLTDVISSRLQHETLRLREASRDVPEPVSDLVMLGLSKEPRQRPSAEEFLQGLLRPAI